MSGEREVEWKGRHAFAEVAEALDLPTDHVMAFWGIGASVFGVMFTPSLEGPPEDTEVFMGVMRRGSDGILRAGKSEYVGRGLEMFAAPGEEDE